MRINVDLIVVLARDSMLFRILNFFLIQILILHSEHRLLRRSCPAERESNIKVTIQPRYTNTYRPKLRKYQPPQENISIIFKLSSFMCKCDKQSKEQREKMNNLVMENKKPN